MGRPTDISGNEEYVRGRRAGVNDTYGASRKGIAEKTVFPGHPDDDGGGEDGLGAASRAMYKNALKNAGGRSGDDGDQAMKDR